MWSGSGTAPWSVSQRRSTSTPNAQGRTGNWRAVSQCGDRVNQLSSITNRRNSQPNQIIRGKFRQDFGIDIVFEERRRKLFEAQAAQPIGDLDRHRKGSRSQVEA